MLSYEDIVVPIPGVARDGSGERVERADVYDAAADDGQAFLAGFAMERPNRHTRAASKRSLTSAA